MQACIMIKGIITIVKLFITVIKLLCPIKDCELLPLIIVNEIPLRKGNLLCCRSTAQGFITTTTFILVVSYTG